MRNPWTRALVRDNDEFDRNLIIVRAEIVCKVGDGENFGWAATKK